MKLLLALFGVTHATDWDGLAGMWSNAAQNANIDESDRKIMELFTISAIANYGCWCRFSNYRPYKGPTQDPIDQTCKTWYQNYDCMGFDYNATCNTDVEYVDAITSVFQPLSPSTDYVTECQNRNADPCAATACAVDSSFIRDIFNFLTDNTLNMTLSGFYGFDGSECGYRTNVVDDSSTIPPVPFTTQPPQSNPAGVTVTAVAQNDCCGSYPTRFPYKTNSGQKACCGQSTYSTGLLECCPNESTALIGAC